MLRHEGVQGCDSRWESDLSKWVLWLVVFLGLYGLHGMEFKWWFEDNYLSVMLYYVGMNVIRSFCCLCELRLEYEFGFRYGTLLLCMMWWFEFCWQSVTLICCMLRVFCLAWKLLVELNVVWGFSYLGTAWRLFRLCEAVEMGPFRLCEVVVEDWFECCTLSLVWRSGKGKELSPYFGSLRV